MVWYIFLWLKYVYICNAIVLRSMKSRDDDSLVEAFTSIYGEL